MPTILNSRNVSDPPDTVTHVPLLEMCVDVVLMIHLFVLLASQTTCSDGIDSSCGWEELDAVISLFYVVECIAKVAVHGWHKYWSVDWKENGHLCSYLRNSLSA